MQINILPIGIIDRDILESISEGLSGIFPCNVSTIPKIPLPEESCNSRRMQYNSSKILGKLRATKT